MTRRKAEIAEAEAESTSTDVLVTRLDVIEFSAPLADELAAMVEKAGEATAAQYLRLASLALHESKDAILRLKGTRAH